MGSSNQTPHHHGSVVIKLLSYTCIYLILLIALIFSCSIVASLLQVKTESFTHVITKSQVITSGEVIVKQNTPEKAMDIRDAIAKILYGRLFSWIVNRINPALNPPDGYG